ncbi:diaminopimelate decarboxylase [Xenorhabdus japonica]|uniref:Diaminopimelate decarboxylase n=1 Tax=Xenorhabdus japonica TaxID=53341 RepID=A0A1I5A1Z9_9GAMM|nr:diaminopimelate decarboxylase [Xenorhabdus japonica]SFN56383.1 diaminopimelate decarboxylase [Xenorhabdus japonica]
MKKINIEEKIARDNGTPFYLYSEDKIIKNINELKNEFNSSNYKILYAMKANSNPYIVKLIYSYGIGVDACSIEEIELALRCNIPSHKIHYNADCLTKNEIEFAFKKNVNVSIGSLDALDDIETSSLEKSITLRVNTGIGAGHSSKVITNGEMSKFGISPSEITHAQKICNAKKIKISGLHSHTGSGEMSTKMYIENAEFLMELSIQLDSLSHLNFGGGFGYDYKSYEQYDLRSIRSSLDLLRKNFNISDKTKFIIEPGRFFVANAGKLVAKVCSLKSFGNRNFMGLNTGYNHFPRCFYYNAWHHIENISAKEKHIEQYDIEKYDVVGNLCQSGDVFTRERPLPKTKKGDLICINDVGAYGYSMSSNFNLRRRPAEYIQDKSGSIIQIRRAENFEDLFSTSFLD